MNYTCSGCGAPMKFDPGSGSLMCEHCHTVSEIPQEETFVEELDFDRYVDTYQAQAGNTAIQKTITCHNCKATVSVDEHLKSMLCLYCGSPLIEANIQEERLIKPGYLLPFRVDQKEVNNLLAKWIRGLWFVPNNLKKAAFSPQNTNGVYLPHWTYDADTYTQYEGMHGRAYYVTRGSGDKKRTERRVDWTYVQGSVNRHFDDIIVTASLTVPKDRMKELEYWDTQNLVSADNKYLSGFITEKYQVDLKQGFDAAKQIMDEGIRQSVRSDIGGDEQRINKLSTSVSHVTFKHILLPIYISTYRYGNKVFNFYVNGRTGQLVGERPYSAIKITLTVLAVLVLFAVLYFVSKR